MSMEGNKTVEIIRKRIIEVRMPGEHAVVYIETDDNGAFINAKSYDLKTYDAGKCEATEINIGEDKNSKEDFPHGTLRVIQNSPWCIFYYDRWGRLIKICSPGSVC